MDYSLLLGVHNLDSNEGVYRNISSLNNQNQEVDDRGEHMASSYCENDNNKFGLSRTRSINRQRLVAHSTVMESIQADVEPIDEEEDVA